MLQGVRNTWQASLRLLRGAVACGGAALLIAACGSLAAAAQTGGAANAPAAEDFDGLRKAYAQALERIESGHRESLEKLAAEYRVAVEDFKARRQASGALEDSLAAVRELERFAGERSLPRAADAENQLLAGVQKPFIESCAKLEGDRTRLRGKLAEKYAARLEATKKALTIAGHFDDAVAVGEEIKRVRPSPVAEDGAAQAKAAEGQDRGRQRRDQSGGAQAAAAVSAASARETGQCKVYTNQPPGISGVDFKPVNLRQTELSRLGLINYALAMGERSSVSKSHSSSYYVTSSSRSGESEHIVRVQLRTVSGKPAVSNASVVVQYFVRRVTRSPGKNPPRQHSVAIAKVDRIGSKPVTVEFPPKTLFKSLYEQHSEYGGSTYRESGDEFYGVLVSVIDSTDAVVFQGSSSGSLDDFGRTTITEYRKDRLQADIQLAERELAAAQSEYYAQMQNAAAKQRFLAAQRRVAELREKLDR